MRLLNTSRGSIDVRSTWRRNGGCKFVPDGIARAVLSNIACRTHDSELMVWTDNDWLVIGSMTQERVLSQLVAARHRPRSRERALARPSQPTVRAHGQNGCCSIPAADC